jgi:hypothetical protein
MNDESDRIKERMATSNNEQARLLVRFAEIMDENERWEDIIKELWRLMKTTLGKKNDR